ncbi:MAG: aminotransferase class I/II-fold pyridoxal phosphate-dependent enzyme [Lachnospiraceae bacterium]|nr:aminotransferase class I/II-fold pyridoxal phosphate-dependent enzyme [Lachnospiraceae bacterium]MBQ2088639.1 aminotransferase class I/II-fold pyridoxal phosphate-dependent enzyme [Lachnospiraceae bacterium]MBQ4300033.1 aminotransferase class I/II-fold pyridoxal phosphate-dependent enzyme [Lachnospiraceae bacterium]
MQSYATMSKEELQQEFENVKKIYKEYQGKGLKLDMSRGKPSPQQLDLGMEMLDVINSSSDMKSENGIDTRNYGLLDGIPETKRLMAEIMEVSPENVMIFGNSSLNTMFDMVARSMIFGVCGETPWCKLDKVKWLCPVPGYDRHFAVTEHFGIEMINVPMSEDGPDMDMVEELVSSDPAIKGIWCVPKYSNPQGVVYSDETVRRMANLKPAAKDFRIYWDNAYIVHHLYGEKMGQILNIIDECEKAGNPDMVYEFASTSKVSLAGSGIAAIASSKKNLDDMKRTVTIQTIGFDKVNMLRHARYFKNAQGVLDHMEKHADILRPRFELVLETLDRELAGRGAGEWIKPKGGYFITYVTLDGCATEVIRLAKEAGVVMTGAGAPFPYHKDPHDSTIRIAPSYPSLEELKDAAEIFTVCVRYATLEKLLNA